MHVTDKPAPIAIRVRGDFERLPTKIREDKRATSLVPRGWETVDVYNRQEGFPPCNAAQNINLAAN
jgi:hypothetical protein